MEPYMGPPMQLMGSHRPFNAPGLRPPGPGMGPLWSGMGPSGPGMGPAGPGLGPPQPGIGPPVSDMGPPGPGIGPPWSCVRPSGLVVGPAGPGVGPPGSSMRPPVSDIGPPGPGIGPPWSCVRPSGLVLGPAGPGVGPPGSSMRPPGLGMGPPGSGMGPAGPDMGPPGPGIGPPAIDIGPPRPDIGLPGQGMGPPASGMGPPGPNMDFLEMDGSGRSLGISPQTQWAHIELSRTSPFGKTSQPVMPNVSIPPANLQHGQPVNPQTENVFVLTTTATGQVYYFNLKTRVSTWGRPQNACIISQAEWEIARSNMTKGFTETEIERLGTAGVPQTNVQQNAAMDSDSSDESEEEVVEHPPKRTKVTEWVEYNAPDGQIYYNNSHTKESVWDKPQALLDLEDRLGTARASQAQTNIQQNAALDVKLNAQDSTGESKEKVVEEKKKLAEASEEKKVEPKPVNKPRPVASTPIPGTVWCVVRTNDGKCFFYDPNKRRSVWKRPEELKNRPDVDKLLSTKPEVKTEEVEVRDVQEEPPSKKIRSEAEVKEVIEESKHEVTQQIVLGEEATIIPGVQASQHSSVVPLEVKMKRFRNLLAEKNISANSTFEKELHKIACDKRYLLLNIRERRHVFDEYVKERAETVRHEQNRKIKEKNALFRQLLEECNLNAKSPFNDFLKYGSRDKRFSMIDNMQDRKSMFLAYINELVEQEKEKKLMKEKAKNDFIIKLSEIPDINHSTTWGDVKSKVSSDTQYEAFDSHREDWFREYSKTLNDVKIDFLKRLSELPGINHSTTWSDVKNKVYSDPRYKTLFSESHRKNWFMEYFKILNDVKTDFMKKMSEIPGIYVSATWSDVRSKVSLDLHYGSVFSDSHRLSWFKEYFKILSDLKNDFMKRLSEIPGINNSTTWNDVKSKVSSDPRYEALVRDSHREKWFRDYLKNLNDVKNDFMKRLSEIPGINHNTTWNDVKHKVSSDPRYEALFRDSHQEDWFMEYLKNLNDVKNDFMKSLSKIPDINNSTTWSSVKTKVTSDQHYAALFKDSHQENWFREYLKTLNDVKNDFMKKLSEIPGINNSTTWSDMKSKVSSDPCHEALVSDSHQENWFREYVKILSDVKNDFMTRLSKIPGIHLHTTFIYVKSKVGSDPRYETLVSDSHREDWYKEYLKILSDMKNDFIKNLSEIPGINRSTTWNYVKSKVTSVPRNETLVSGFVQEYWFREYLKNLNDAKNDFMKRLSQIHSININTTWIDVESEMNSDSHYNAFVSDSHRADWFSEYLKIIDKKEQDKKRYPSLAEILENRKRQREEALRDFKQFIVEKVTDPGCSFLTFKSICAKDYKLTIAINDQEMQHLFTNHLDNVRLETKRKQEMVKDDFMKMLSEIPDTNLNTTWSDVKSKVSSDPRYEAVVSDSNREDWFREYLKNQNDMVKNDFMKQLSEIPGINLSTIWNDVKNKVSLDPCYEALISESHREDWFKEHLKTQHDMVKTDFMKKLSEIPGINCSTTWNDVKSQVSSDPHYETLVSDSHREDWIQEYVKIVNNMKNDFMKILSETPGINDLTTWSYINNKLSSDPQYKSLASDSHREDWFKEYLKTLNDARNNFMKKLSEIPGINNRTTWKDVESKMNSDAHYEALFSNFHREKWIREYVNILQCMKKNFMNSLSKIPGINNSTIWSEVKSKVSSDPRYEALFSDSHRQDWFGEYLKILNDEKNNFMESLSKIPGINHSTAWSDIKFKVISCLQYKTLVSDSHLEDWFKEYLENLNYVKNDFMKRLSETPGINHSTIWSNMKSEMSSDSQYKALFSDFHRENWFMEHFKNLSDVKDDFMKMLSEIPGINHSMTWNDVGSKVSSDPRYKAVVHDSQRVDWFREYLKRLYQEKNNFMENLSKIPGINHSTAWSDIKSKVISCPQFKTLVSDSHLEDWFKEYLENLNYVKNNFMKRLSETPGINYSTAWNDMKSEMSSDSQYKALFSDFHREKWFMEYFNNLCNVKDDFMKMLSEIPGINHNKTWNDVGSKVSSDPRYKAVVHDSQRVDWFREYLKRLYQEKNNFMENLSKIPGINHSTAWSDLKTMVTSRPQFKTLVSDSHREAWFKEYLKNLNDAKNDFMKRLSETPGINNSTTWRYVKSRLSSDPQYKALFSDSHRENWFKEYLKNLCVVKDDFMKMLSEIPGINHSTSWNDVESKVNSDPRYMAVARESHREDWFKEYLMRLYDMVKNNFLESLGKTPDINHNSTWTDVKSKVSSDPRYEALVSDSQREDWFQEYLKIFTCVKNDFMKRLSKIPGINNSTTWSNVKLKVVSDVNFAALFSDSHQENWFQEYLQAKNDFMKRLSETPGIDHSTTWKDVESKVSSDPSCEAFFNDSYRENWFQEYLKNLNDMKNDFMEMLSEIPGINHHTTWHDVESKVSSDPRYKAVVSDSQRELLFTEYLKIVNDLKTDFMKRLSEIPGINNSTAWSDVKLNLNHLRYKTYQKYKTSVSISRLFTYVSNSHNENWFQEYLKSLNNAKNDFMKRLSETPGINHSTTWKDVESKVGSDPSCQAFFNDSYRENWFQEYLKNLNNMKNDFMKMLSEIPGINHHSTWNDVESKVSSDPRYKAVVDDSQREELFTEYLKVVNDVKDDFMKKLSKIPGINHSTIWSDVKSKVTSDLHYEAFFSDSLQEDWFCEYLKDLNNLKIDFMKKLSEIPGINNSTTWNDVKLKVNSDIRYETNVSDSYQEDWFQEYLNNLINVKNDFMKRLSEIPGINNSTTWGDVKSRVSLGSQFEALFSDSHRQNWFREYLKTLSDLKTDFMKKLSEIPDINNSTTWNDVKLKVNSDIRYETNVSDSYQEDWFQEYLNNLINVKNDFMKKLSEIPGISDSTAWSYVNSKVSLDPQYKALFSDSHQQNWLREYLKTLSDVKDDFIKELKKIPGINDSTTWSDVKCKVISDPQYEALISDSHQENWFSEYLKTLNDVKKCFIIRLNKLPSINNTTTWSDVKTKIGTLSRYEALFSDSHREDWLKEYLESLNDAKNDFMKRLSEILNINNNTPWSYVKNIVGSNPHYKAFFINSQLENWFREYLKTLNDVKNDFMKRLSEIPGIHHCTTWKDVESKVSSDPLSGALFSDSHREKWFKEYLKNLNDVRNDFMKRLSKLPDIDHSTTWSDVKIKMSSDPCPSALFRDSFFEDWFREFLKKLNDAKNDFTESLGNIPGIIKNTNWSYVKSRLRSDPHCETLFTDQHREKWFCELKNLNNVKKDFMKMLSEIPGIHRRTTWSDVIIKVDSDPRYKAAANNSQVEDWFQEYLKNLNVLVANNFMLMLRRIPDINRYTRWRDVKSKVRSDVRYKAEVSDSQREDWFREYVKTVIDVTKNNFMKMLSEIPSINHHTSWRTVKSLVRSDPRYRAEVSESHREDWFREYLKTVDDVVKNNFMKMLSETPVTNNSATWSDMKSKVSSDPRYKAVVSYSQREDFFTEYLKFLNDIKNDFMKMLSEIAVIKESTDWKDVKIQLRSDPRNAAAVSNSQRLLWFQEFLKNLTNVKNEFMKMLSEIPVSNLSTVWSCVKIQVSSDPRNADSVSNFQRALWFQEFLKNRTNTTDPGPSVPGFMSLCPRQCTMSRSVPFAEKKMLCDSHIDEKKKNRAIIWSILDEIDLSDTHLWYTIRNRVEANPKADRFTPKQWKNEKKHAVSKHQKFLKAKEDFQELLKESKFISHKTKALGENAVKHITGHLKKDKRFTALACIASQRQKMLLAYIDDLSMKGPPPPPVSASAPPDTGTSGSTL